MPIDSPASPPKLALAPDWYVEAPKPPNFDENRPGLYEWRIEGKGSYIGQYRWISRPRREYGLNVAVSSTICHTEGATRMGFGASIGSLHQP